MTLRDLDAGEFGDTIRPRPWLSIILPVYRGEPWVATTLESIAYDPEPGIEVVVIDTSPTSGTLDIVRRFENRLTIRIFKPTDIDGCSPKMNFGVAQANSDHVTWLCQDDLWLPGRAKAVRQWIDQHPDAVLHLAPTAIIDREGKRLGVCRCPLLETATPLDTTELCERLLVQNFVAVVSPVVRRDAWLACGGIDLDLWYTGDWDLWLKLARHGKVYYHDAVTAAFRVHSDSMTSKGSRNRSDFMAQMRIVVDRHIANFSAHKVHQLRRLADTSIVVNTELAAAANGDRMALVRAGLAVLALGPLGAWRYLHYSRVLERTLPRMRARLAGAL